MTGVPDSPAVHSAKNTPPSCPALIPHPATSRNRPRWCHPTPAVRSTPVDCCGRRPPLRLLAGPVPAGIRSIWPAPECWSSEALAVCSTTRPLSGLRCGAVAAGPRCARRVRRCIGWTPTTWSPPVLSRQGHPDGGGWPAAPVRHPDRSLVRTGAPRSW